jgi:hypothetical protein
MQVDGLLAWDDIGILVEVVPSSETEWLPLLAEPDVLLARLQTNAPSFETLQALAERIYREWPREQRLAFFRLLT